MNNCIRLWRFEFIWWRQFRRVYRPVFTEFTVIEIGYERFNNDVHGFEFKFLGMCLEINYSRSGFEGEEWR